MPPPPTPQLVEAASKGPNDPDTLINLVACYEHMGKPTTVIERYLSQLKAAAPQHPYVKALATVDGAFDRVATQFKPRVHLWDGDPCGA